MRHWQIFVKHLDSYWMEIEVFVRRLNLCLFNQRAWGAPGSLSRQQIFVMHHKRKIKITVTRRELLYTLGERRRVSRTAWCTECAGDFSVLTPGLAAEFLSVSTREIYRMVEAGRLHYTEAPDQELFICLNSLLVAEPNIQKQSGVNQ
jgi:hypothetical protein